MRRSYLLSIIVVLVSLAGCASSDSTGAADAGTDRTTDRGGLTDQGSDSPTDTPPVDTGGPDAVQDQGGDDAGGDDTGGDDTGGDDTGGDDTGGDDAGGDDAADATPDAAEDASDTGTDASSGLGDACSSVDDRCGAGLGCITRSDGTNGICAPDSCSSFYGDACGSGANCLVFDGDGVCVITGSAGAGAACPTGHQDCQAGLICVGGACEAPECSADNTTSPCPIPREVCEPYSAGDATSDVGICFAPCTPFVGSECESTEFCVAFDRDAETGDLRGACVPEGDGTVPVGGDCSSQACVDGSFCLQVDLDELCFAACDAEAADGEPGFCGEAGELCAPLFDTDTGEQIDLGYCTVGCVPFLSPSECDPDDWCDPGLFVMSVGDCVAETGTAAIDDACGALTGTCCQVTPGVGGCGADATIASCVCDLDSLCCSAEWDSTCVDLAQSDCSATCTLPVDQECGADLVCIDTCRAICNPAVPTGELGACPAGEACGGLSVAGEPIDLGVCADGCDFHGGTDTCADSTEYCQAGEALGVATDQCLAIPDFFPDGDGLDLGAACPEAIPAFTFCGPGAICLDSGDGGLTCQQMCFTSQGDFGTAADCVSGTCTDSLGSDEVGLCQ